MFCAFKYNMTVHSSNITPTCLVYFASVGIAPDREKNMKQLNAATYQFLHALAQ